MKKTYDFKGLDVDILIMLNNNINVLFSAIATLMFSS